MRLKGKIAIVTGGSQGIGEAIARRFSQSGARVAIVGRNLEKAQIVVDALNVDGGEARAYSADLSQVEQIAPMVDAVARDFGGIDIVCNSAGVFRTLPIEETTEAIWDEQLDLNLKGSFFLVKAVRPHLLKGDGGKIILLSSIAGERGFPNCPAYCASKGGLTNLTKALAIELAKHKININAIAPGNVETSMNAHLRGSENTEYMQLMSDRTPTGRAFLDPDDIASVALFLASNEASAMHGAIVLVDDGWCAS